MSWAPTMHQALQIQQRTERSLSGSLHCLCISLNPQTRLLPTEIWVQLNKKERKVTWEEWNALTIFLGCNVYWIPFTQSCRRFPLSSQNMPQLLLIATDTFIAQELIIIKEKTNWDPLCIGLLRQTFPFSSIDISFIKKKMVKLINWCWKVQLFRQLHGFISVHLIQTNFEDHRATSNFLRG